MDGRQPEYQQTGLTSPPYTRYPEPASEESSADQSSAVPYNAPQDYKPSTYSASATPSSDYSVPQTARSGSFPEYIQRSYADGQPQGRYPPSATSGHPAMAQTSNPSIAQSSPTYPPSHQYSPYPPQHEMQYPGHPMSYARPDWANHYQQQMYGQAPASGPGGPPHMAGHVPRPPPGGHPLSTVYSFVPIPGAQQHKRPRRRYEEIERMYKCGWNGCEKAYGTLNHLNAHVTMQSHGPKRTPEEFKEIRKEWKAKKKEEENQRKQEEERQRQEAARNGQDPNHPHGPPGQYGQGMMPHHMGGPQLPPIAYQNPGGQAPGQYPQTQQVDGSQQYPPGTQMYGAQGYPQSPYTQGGLPYQQHQAGSQSYQPQQ